MLRAALGATPGRLPRARLGRLDGADSMLTVNHALRDLFARFELTATPAGVLVRPVLDAATAERVMTGIEHWPHGLSLGDYAAEQWRGAVVVLGAEPGDDLSGEQLRPADPVASALRGGAA